MVAAGSAASVADDSAELDTSEVEVQVCVGIPFIFVQFSSTHSVLLFSLLFCFTCLPVSAVSDGVSCKCIPNPFRVLVNKNCLNRVGLK